MKKIARIIASFATITSLTLIPVAVHAQDSGVIDVSGTSSTSSTSSTTPTTAGVPNTGVAPRQSKFAQNSMVFIGGSLLGTAAGLAIVTVRKKRLNQ